MKGATKDLFDEAAQKLISIHAPVKGATSFPSISDKIEYNFNPRPREGSDVQNDQNAGTKPTISIHAPVKGATLSAVR